MPIQISWDSDEKNIVVAEYSGRWQWEEFFAASQQTNTMMRSVSYRVDFIANMKNGYIPPKGALFTFAKNAFSILPANWGIVVIIVNPFVGQLALVFKKFDKNLGEKLYTATSMEQAREIIAQHRSPTASQ
jgi:hypothetical protein